MKDLNWQLKQLCERNRDGSYATQANRRWLLSQIADQLHEAGFRQLETKSLKPKHIEALVERWKAEQLSASSLKNRLSALRWWAEKMGRQNVIARSNDHYGIPNRTFVTNRSKAKVLEAASLDKIKDPYIRVSLLLQREFGLRREECMKFQPSYADKGDRIVLKPSWTKGGRAREVPVRTDSQRAALDAAARLAGAGSMIPADRSYIEHLRVYEGSTRLAGLSKLHGLRHAYAQRRYEELTGWKAPAAGGPTARQLTAAQKEVDRAARLTVSAELGHGREQITAVYLGR